MTIRKYLYQVGLLVVLLTCGNTVFSQVTVTKSNDINCVVPTATLTATMTGDAPIDAGITIDDQYPPTPTPIGFSFNFYGTSYTSCLIGPNGTISFNTSLAGMAVSWVIPATFLGTPAVYNSICGPWTDVDIVFGGTIKYSTDGVAPNRKFVVTFCATHMFSCTDEWLTTQMILYETSNIIEVHLGHRTICSTGWNGSKAVIGVQNATGTAATVAPGRDVSPTWVAINEGWRFIPNSTYSAYTVGSIPYAPIPYASSAIYWYDITAGTYLGSTPTTPIDPTTGVATLVVSPTVTTTYKAAALGCADTSFAFVTVTVSTPLTVTATFSNPTLCGVCDGTITLAGMNPGNVDTINYTVDGMAQPTVIATVSPMGTVTLTGLCGGLYNITVKQGSCTASPPPVTLAYPAIAISGVTQTNVSWCGVCDGKLVLHGLYPSHMFTVSYNFNGTPQTPVPAVSNAAGDITLSGLCEGTYDNIVAYFSVCTTAAVGPYTISSPPIPPARVFASVNPTECGLYTGSITLKGLPPFSSDTVTFDRNGIPQAAVITATFSDSTIYLPGLNSGTYSNFNVKIGKCVYPVVGSATLIDPPLKARFSSFVTLGCKGDSVRFTNLSTSTGPLYYIWKFGDGSTDTSKNPLHIYAQGTYTVTMYATNHACIDSADTSYVFDHPLNAAFTAAPMIVCQGAPVSFTNSSVGNGATYLWNFGDGATSTASNPTNSFVNSGSYNVQLIVTDNIPCKDTAYVQVQVDTISSTQISLTDSVLCSGTYVTFTAHYAALGSTGITWDFGYGDSILNVNPVSHALIGGHVTYTVTATPHYRACIGTPAMRVLNVFPQPTISLGGDTSICAGSEMITLKDEVNGGNSAASWAWSNGSRGPSTVVVAPGIYFATVNINNCLASDTVVVNPDCYMNIPNVFTPNGDGVNDYFYPRSLLTRGLTAFKMDIYNRWGQLIFETTSLDGAGWDGKMNGVMQPQGVFVYIIDATFRDGQKEHHQGNVTLMR